MTRLSDTAVDAIAQQVLAKLHGGQSAEPTSLSRGQTESLARGGELPAGVFRTIDECVAAATIAFGEFARLGLEQRKAVIASIRASMMEHAVSLSQEAVEETGIGRLEDKIIKNRLVTSKVPGTEVLEARAVSGDAGLTIIERAPYGIIGAITPTTNPTATVICNTIGMLAAGNTVVFNVHPNAKHVSCRNVGLINEAVMKAGGPANTITAMAEPTIASATELMHHKGIRLLVVTGGSSAVNPAKASRKRALRARPSRLSLLRPPR